MSAPQPAINTPVESEVKPEVKPEVEPQVKIAAYENFTNMVNKGLKELEGVVGEAKPQKPFYFFGGKKSKKGGKKSKKGGKKSKKGGKKSKKSVKRR